MSSYDNVLHSAKVLTKVEALVLVKWAIIVPSLNPFMFPTVLTLTEKCLPGTAQVE